MNTPILNKLMVKRKDILVKKKEQFREKSKVIYQIP